MMGPPTPSSSPSPPRQANLIKLLCVFVVVALYWTISIAMVFVNKSLLSGRGEHFSAPLFVTWFQCVVSVFLLHSMQIIFTVFKRIPGFPEQLSVQPSTCLSVLPLSSVFLAMIAANNLCLKNVGVSFYYVARSLSTVFNIAMAYVALGQKTSSRAVSCCALVVFGFWLGVDQELLLTADIAFFSSSKAGIAFGVASSLLVAANAVFTKRVLPLVEDNLWQLNLVNNFNASLLFIPLIFLTGEADVVLNSSEIYSAWFWLEMVAAGFLGFAIGCVTGLQIQVTSPLMHSISGTAKSAAQTLLATRVYGESKSVMWWVANFLVLGGSAAYAKAKQIELTEKLENINGFPHSSAK